VERALVVLCCIPTVVLFVAFLVLGAPAELTPEQAEAYEAGYQDGRRAGLYEAWEAE